MPHLNTKEFLIAGLDIEGFCETVQLYNLFQTAKTALKIYFRGRNQGEGHIFFSYQKGEGQEKMSTLKSEGQKRMGQIFLYI